MGVDEIQSAILLLETQIAKLFGASFQLRARISPDVVTAIYGAPSIGPQVLV